jgi:hypothetical protein
VYIYITHLSLPLLCEKRSERVSGLSIIVSPDLFSTILYCQYNKRFIVNALNEALKSLNKAIKLSYLYFEHWNAAQNPHFVL